MRHNLQPRYDISKYQDPPGDTWAFKEMSVLSTRCHTPHWRVYQSHPFWAFNVIAAHIDCGFPESSLDLVQHVNWTSSPTPQCHGETGMHMMCDTYH